MARETKVGVLTGLAFIICFAVVLANRGTSRTEPTLAHHQSRSIHDAGSSGQDSPLVGTSSRAGGFGRGMATTDGAVVSSRPPVNQPETSIAAGSVYAVQPTTRPRVESGSPRSMDESQASASQSKDSVAGHSGQINSPVPLPGLIPRQVPPIAIQVRGDERPVTTSLKSTSTPGLETVRYVVAPGETLWSLAARAYGKKSGALVQAIFEANRTVLSSPDSIMAGMALELPPVPGFGSPSGASPVSAKSANERVNSSPSTGSKPVALARESGRSRSADAGGAPRPASNQRTKPAEAGSTDYRWYNVRKNDRLMGIAREQLGDAGRWEEIHALNKDKFPDPEKIREGVRIKLPAAKSESRRNQGT
jgi:nucleoid-associated protein YgaU